MSIFAFSLISFVSLFLASIDGLVFYISIATILLSGACYFIIPATNNARDNGNDRLFSVYHNLSVFSTLTMLVINLISFFSYHVFIG